MALVINKFFLKYSKGAPIKAPVKHGQHKMVKLKIPIIITSNEHPRKYLEEEQVEQLMSRCIVRNFHYFYFFNLDINNITLY